MRNTLLILFVSLIAAVKTVRSQNILDKYPAVRSYKEKIDKDTTLRFVTIENEEFLEHIDQGGELIGYYKDSL